LLAKVDQSDLVRTSAVVIYGELENKSEPFIVKSTSGDKFEKNLDNQIITEEYYNICIDELSKTATYVN
jgi:hypothetical protein